MRTASVEGSRGDVLGTHDRCDGAIGMWAKQALKLEEARAADEEARAERQRRYGEADARAERLAKIAAHARSDLDDMEAQVRR